MLLVNARRDERVPEACVRLLYAKAGQPKDLVWLDTGHIQPSNRELIDSVTEVVTAWLEKNGLL